MHDEDKPFFSSASVYELMDALGKSLGRNDKITRAELAAILGYTGENAALGMRRVLANGAEGPAAVRLANIERTALKVTGNPMVTSEWMLCVPTNPVRTPEYTAFSVQRQFFPRIEILGLPNDSKLVEYENTLPDDRLSTIHIDEGGHDVMASIHFLDTWPDMLNDRNDPRLSQLAIDVQHISKAGVKALSDHLRHTPAAAASTSRFRANDDKS